MKLTLIGRSRHVVTHVRKVAPFASKILQRPGRPLTWETPWKARGVLRNLALSGDFNVHFEFTEAELKNWLSTYIRDEPQKALELMSKVQLDAMRKLLGAKK